MFLMQARSIILNLKSELPAIYLKRNGTGEIKTTANASSTKNMYRQQVERPKTVIYFCLPRKSYCLYPVSYLCADQ